MGIHMQKNEFGSFLSITFKHLAQMVKNLPAMQETQVWPMSREDPLEKGMTTLSSILAWRIPWTEEPGGLHPWNRKESDMTERLTLSLHFIFKNPLKMDQRPEYKSLNDKTLRRKHKYKSLWYWIREWFLKYYTQSTRNQRKSRYLELNKNLKLLPFKGHYQESGKATHRMWEYFCKSCYLIRV